jgi:hypothetical protein
MRHGKIQAKIVRSTTRQAKIKGIEFFSGASEKQSSVRHLSILNFHCTLCCDLTDLSAEMPGVTVYIYIYIYARYFTSDNEPDVI